MSQPAFDLRFVHKFNLYQGAGLSIDEDDIAAIARIYGMSVEQLEGVEGKFRANVARLAAELRDIVPARPAGEPYRMIAAGDSITADREGYVNILRTFWGDDSGRTIINAGRSGETTVELRGRFQRDILSQEFEKAVLFIGTNDSGGPAGSDGQVSREEYARNMEYLVCNLLDAQKEVIQVTLPPIDNERMKRYFGDENWFAEKTRIDAANDFIRDQSRRYGTTLADLAAEIEGRGIDPLLPDGLHMNDHGQKLLAELLAKVLS